MDAVDPIRESAYEQWMIDLDREIARRCGLSVHDLPDQPFRDYFEDEMSPGDAANQILLDEMDGTDE